MSVLMGSRESLHCSIHQIHENENNPYNSGINQGTRDTLCLFSHVAPISFLTVYNPGPEGIKLLLQNDSGKESYITSPIMSMKRAHIKEHE